MSDVVLSIYKQDVSRLCGYVYSYNDLSMEKANEVVRSYASNYYNSFDMRNLIKISSNNYMFDVISLSDKLESEEEKVEEETFSFKSEDDSDIKVSIYDETANRVCGFVYSNDELDRDIASYKVKHVLRNFGYNIGIVNFTTINDKKFIFDARTKTDEYDQSIKRLTKER